MVFHIDLKEGLSEMNSFLVLESRRSPWCCASCRPLGARKATRCLAKGDAVVQG